MSARRRWLADLALAGVIGGAAGTAAVALLHAAQDGPTAEELSTDLRRSDRVAEVLTGLREDGVHVTDDGRYLLDGAGERRVEEAVARADGPVYVLVWAEGQHVGASDYDVADHLARELADEGVLISYAGPRIGASSVEVLGERGGYVDLTADDLTGEAATTLPAAVDRASEVDYYDDDDGDGLGPVGGTVSGLLLGLGGAAVVLLLGWAVRRRLGLGPLRGRWGWRT